MQVTDLAIEGVKLVETRRFSDDRGFFSEVYNQRVFEEAGIDCRFVQDNHSHSIPASTVRGLHYQSPPMAQAKLVRVIKGAVLDVVVDIRKGSPTFGKHVGAELSEENFRQIFVPRGFLHGFITLRDDCHVVYKVDNFYSGECDGSVRFDDPALGIDWGELADRAVLSSKDEAAPGWADFDSPFTYGAAF